MNELMIYVYARSWIYYRTNEMNANKALMEFFNTCENAGINIDNLEIRGYELRDSDGNKM